ncbi:MAG: deoxyribonuclease IV [Planctomycetota bacterium]
MTDRVPRQLRTGFHVSISGGLDTAVERAVERGCSCLQIFCGNPRGWRHSERDEGEVEDFRRMVNRHQMDPVVVHACYLINPCAPDDRTYANSQKRLTEELRTAGRIGADYYVIHPGSSKQKGPGWAGDRAVQCFANACEKVKNRPRIMLENTAGEYGPGGSFDLLGELIEGIESEVEGEPPGLVVDTCHAFAAGYDLRSNVEVGRLAEDIEDGVGLCRMGLLHVNDSAEPCGSGKDRHAHIGEGRLGIGGFRAIFRDTRFRRLPAILETPWKSAAKDRDNIGRIKEIRNALI